MAHYLGVEFDLVGTPRPVPAAVRGAFIAVARESLTNINKHAAGQRVSASLIFEGDRIRMELINGLPKRPAVSDIYATDVDDSDVDDSDVDDPDADDPDADDPDADDPDADDLARSGSGLGLSGMTRRMAEAGGTLHSGTEGNRWVVEARWTEAGSGVPASQESVQPADDTPADDSPEEDRT